MTLTPLAISTVAAVSVAAGTITAVVEGMDTATILLIGTVVTGIITTISLAIVKVLGALQEMKVALIVAAADRSKAAEKVAEQTEQLTAIGASSDGALSAMGKRLDEALRHINEMQKAAEARAIPPMAAPTAPVPGSPEAPLEMKISNTVADPANVNQIAKP